MLKGVVTSLRQCVASLWDIPGTKISDYWLLTTDYFFKGDAKMKPWLKMLIVTVVIAIPAFLLEPRAPLGGFWAPHHALPTPPGGLVPFFLVLGLFDALSLGAAVSF